MPYLCITLLSLALAAALTGCGQMGPLYVPTEEESRDAGAERADPAPADREDG
ncbi:MAG: lipoprotein [Halioglobus sp.]|nr:lipoprotein [Halioglobus sp.]